MPPTPICPIIGLNTAHETDATSGRSIARTPYWEAPLKAGGLPLLLPQLRDPQMIDQALDLVDGFILIGGDDLKGELFGQETLPTVVEVEPPRLETDFTLIEALIRRRIPTLALCLGFQELNVHLGGTLYQDIPFDAPPTQIRHDAKQGPTPRHEVEVEPDTLLARSLSASATIVVNSIHHQAINKLGRGLRVSARAPDGLIEAVELENHPFFLGVQWHPERMDDSRPQARLFEALINFVREPGSREAGNATQAIESS